LQEDPIGMLIGMGDNTRYIYPNPNYDEFLDAIGDASILSFGPEYNLSLYRYVDNNPINLIDPTGLFGVGHIAKARHCSLIV